MKLKRVVVTGLGAVSPIGNNVNDFKENLFAGKSGAAPFTRFDTTNYTGGSYTARSASINTKHASSYAEGAHDQSSATHSIRAPSFLRAATHHDHRNPNPGLPGWLFRNAGAKSNKNLYT